MLNILFDNILKNKRILTMRVGKSLEEVEQFELGFK